MPETVTLEAQLPGMLSHLSRQQFASKLAAKLKLQEAALLERNAREGKTIMGREAVLAQNPYHCPKGHEPRRGLNPRIACADKWRRIETLGRLKEFLNAYREAWQDFKRGVKDVIWPPGTYWMCRHAGMPCVPPE